MTTVFWYAAFNETEAFGDQAGFYSGHFSIIVQLLNTLGDSGTG